MPMDLDMGILKRDGWRITLHCIALRCGAWGSGAGGQKEKGREMDVIYPHMLRLSARQPSTLAWKWSEKMKSEASSFMLQELQIIQERDLS